MQCGFIKLHRQILDWEWYDDPNTMRLFLHCLLRANHKDNNWRGILIKRGSFLTSLETLSKETKLSISQIRTSLKKLKSTNEIASLSQARHRVITVVSYDSYQGNDKVNSKIVTGSSQDSDKVVTTNKNDKNDKNDKNVKNLKKKIPYQLIVDIYHEVLPELPRVKILDDSRKRKIKTLFDFDDKHKDLDWWKNYFDYIRGSDFLMNRLEHRDEKHKNWKSGFDFLIKKETFVKTIEGFYHQ